MPHLTPSVKALAAARRSHFLPFKFSMMVLPWTQAVLLSISDTNLTCTLRTETHPSMQPEGAWCRHGDLTEVPKPKPARGLSAVTHGTTSQTHPLLSSVTVSSCSHHGAEWLVLGAHWCLLGRPSLSCD